MKSRLSIENVTNGLLTLQKLTQLYKPERRRDENEGLSYVRQDKLLLLQETLTSITDFLPETRGDTFDKAFSLGCNYCSAYRGIKQHVRDMDGNRFNSAHVLKSLKLVVPMLNSKHRLYMDKAVKIFDILQS